MEIIYTPHWKLSTLETLPPLFTFLYIEVSITKRDRELNTSRLK